MWAWRKHFAPCVSAYSVLPPPLTANNNRMGITGVPFWTVYREGKEDEDPVTLSGHASSKIFKKLIEDLSF